LEQRLLPALAQQAHRSLRLPRPRGGAEARVLWGEAGLLGLPMAREVFRWMWVKREEEART
jgi:hypothetical protein